MMATAQGSSTPSYLGELEVEVKGNNGAYFKAYVLNIFEKEVLVGFEDNWQSSRKVPLADVRLPDARTTDPSDLEARRDVEVFSRAKESEPCGWWRARILQCKGEFYVIEYIGWDTQFNEIVEKDRLRLPNRNPPLTASSFFKCIIEVPDNVRRACEDMTLHRDLLKACHAQTVIGDTSAGTITLLSQSEDTIRRAQTLADFHVRSLQLKVSLKQRALGSHSREVLNRAEGFVETFSIEDSLMGLAIGARGKNIDACRKMQGIQDVELIDATNTFRIYGESPEAVQAARNRLEYCQEAVPIAKELVARIIGKQGANIQDIVDKSGVNRVVLEDSSTGQADFVFTGLRDRVDNARILLEYHVLMIGELDSLSGSRRRGRQGGDEQSGGDGRFPRRTWYQSSTPRPERPGMRNSQQRQASANYSGQQRHQPSARAVGQENGARGKRQSNQGADEEDWFNDQGAYWGQDQNHEEGASPSKRTEKKSSSRKDTPKSDWADESEQMEDHTGGKSADGKRDKRDAARPRGYSSQRGQRNDETQESSKDGHRQGGRESSRSKLHDQQPQREGRQKSSAAKWQGADREREHSTREQGTIRSQNGSGQHADQNQHQVQEQSHEGEDERRQQRRRHGDHDQQHNDQQQQERQSNDRHRTDGRSQKQGRQSDERHHDDRRSQKQGRWSDERHHGDGHSPRQGKGSDEQHRGDRQSERRSDDQHRSQNRQSEELQHPVDRDHRRQERQRNEEPAQYGHRRSKHQQDSEADRSSSHQRERSHGKQPDSATQPSKSGTLHHDAPNTTSRGTKGSTDGAAGGRSPRPTNNRSHGKNQSDSRRRQTGLGRSTVSSSESRRPRAEGAKRESADESHQKPAAANNGAEDWAKEIRENESKQKQKVKTPEEAEV